MAKTLTGAQRVVACGVVTSLAPTIAAWRALDGRIWRLAFARGVGTFGLSLVMSFLGIHMVTERGVPATHYGIILLLANSFQAMVSAWAGKRSDRVGRKRLILHSLWWRALIIALLGAAVWIEAPLWLISLCILASSALRGSFEPVAYAMVADVASGAERIHAYALQRVGINLGWMFGPAVGGLCSLWLPYGAVFLIAAALLGLAGYLVWPIMDVPPSPRKHDEPAPALPRAGRYLVAATFLAALVHSQVFTTLSVYLTEELAMTKFDIGLLYSINGGIVALFLLVSASLAHWVGIGRMLSTAALLYAAGFVVIGAVHSFAGVAVALGIITLGEVLFAPAHQTAIANLAEPHQRGARFGQFQQMQTFGVACAPLLGGLLLDAFGHQRQLWLVVAAAAVALVVVLIGYRRAAA